MSRTVFKWMEVCGGCNINQWGQISIGSDSITHRHRQHCFVECIVLFHLKVFACFFSASCWYEADSLSSRWAKTKKDGFPRLSLQGGRLSSLPPPSALRTLITPALLQLASRAARTRTVVDGFELPASDPAGGLGPASRDAAGHTVNMCRASGQREGRAEITWGSLFSSLNKIKWPVEMQRFTTKMKKRV